MFITCLSFLNFEETFLARNSFVQPFFATDDNTVARVEPETERQSNSCDSSAINVIAGVGVSLSGQENEASELDDDRQECVYCFCSPCVTCVRQQWLGHGQVVYKRNSRIRKKLCRKFWFMMNMHGHPLCVCKKETVMC